MALLRAMWISLRDDLILSEGGALETNAQRAERSRILAAAKAAEVGLVIGWPCPPLFRCRSRRTCKFAGEWQGGSQRPTMSLMTSFSCVGGRTPCGGPLRASRQEWGCAHLRRTFLWACLDGGSCARARTCVVLCCLCRHLFFSLTVCQMMEVSRVWRLVRSRWRPMMSAVTPSSSPRPSIFSHTLAKDSMRIAALQNDLVKSHEDRVSGRGGGGRRARS